MASKKLFKGLAQNIAHHSGSVLCALHPNLGSTLYKAGGHTVTIDLLKDSRLQGLNVSADLSDAISVWRARFREISGKIGVDITQLTSAKVDFDFSAYQNYFGMADTKVELIHKDGTIFEADGWRPDVSKPGAPIPGTNLDWPDEFLEKNH